MPVIQQGQQVHTQTERRAQEPQAKYQKSFAKVESAIENLIDGDVPGVYSFAKNQGAIKAHACKMLVASMTTDIHNVVLARTDASQEMAPVLKTMYENIDSTLDHLHQVMNMSPSSTSKLRGDLRQYAFELLEARDEQVQSGAAIATKDDVILQDLNEAANGLTRLEYKARDALKIVDVAEAADGLQNNESGSAMKDFRAAVSKIESSLVNGKRAAISYFVADPTKDPENRNSLREFAIEVDDKLLAALKDAANNASYRNINDLRERHSLQGYHLYADRNCSEAPVSERNIDIHHVLVNLLSNPGARIRTLAA